MIINASSIKMNSGRFFSSSTEFTQKTTAKNENGTQMKQSSFSFSQTYAEYSGTKQENQALSQYDRFIRSDQDENATKHLLSDPYTDSSKNRLRIVDVHSAMENFRKQLMKQLEAFMERIRKQLLGSSKASNMQNEIETSIVDLTTSLKAPGSLWTIQQATTTKQIEMETTSFSSTGTVQTADGRTIEFDVSMEMSRTFIQECTQLSEDTQYILTDPLVVQLEDVPESISEQTWFFDLDCDGQKEELSQLAKGNGFLALDRNENGIIDDGSELFGTQSGNGFQDLAKFDEDGNGFIDENDSVYSKLKIWTKNADGNDTLMNLQQADIGAIYLGYADTEFSHNQTETNSTKAVVKNTGIFLHESTGTTGFIQQIDFATRKPA